MAKNNRRNSGWARTKTYPHKRHPARYRKRGNDEIDYLTFTHSETVQLPNGDIVQTIPLTDNISEQEREDNKRKGLKPEQNRSYVFPKLYRGKRSALQSEVEGLSLVPEDKEKVDRLFNELPVENVPTTGGSGHYHRRRKRKNKE